MSDLTICQDCHQNPAVYGDGLTWSRCAKCELKHNKEEGIKQPEVPEGPSGQSFEHKIVPGLVSIIMPVYMGNYALFHYTGNAIGSIREHTPEKSFELIIVDNGSKHQPPNLNAYYAQKVIKNEENLGVTKAWNQGIRASVGEYIVLISNDVLVYDHWLEDMKDVLNGHKIDLLSAQPMYSLTEPFARAIEANKLRDKFITKDTLDKKVDFSCVMIRRSLIDEIGLFDERFFNYCSDSDFIRSMEKMGKKYGSSDHIAVTHFSNATGYYMKDNASIMEKDKATFEEKWKVDTSKGKLVRVKDGGDPIYYIKGEKYHHISDPDTLHAMGFEFGQEVMVATLNPYKEGETLTKDNYKNYV